MSKKRSPHGSNCTPRALGRHRHAGLHDVRAADAAHEAARRDFKRDLAAAKICQHQAFAWEGNTLTCFKEATR